MRKILYAVGSLWLAAAVLISLIVVLAGATVFEVRWGADSAAEEFYGSPAMRAMSLVLAANMLAAMLIRWGSLRKKIGFTLTHSAILIIIVGAWITSGLGVSGQMALSAGQVAREFTVDRPAVILMRASGEASGTADAHSNSMNRGLSTRAGQDEVADAGATSQPVRASMSLAAEIRRRSWACDLAGRSVTLEGLTFTADRYLPDAEPVRFVRSAVEHELLPVVSALQLGYGVAGTTSQPTTSPNDARTLWLVSGVTLAPDQGGLMFVQTQTPAEFDRWIHPPKDDTSSPMLKITWRGQTWPVPVDTARERGVPLGESGLIVRVERYLSHAVVGDDGRLQDCMDRPVNPAAEVRIVSVDGNDAHLVFARFPEFRREVEARHAIADIDVQLIVPNVEPDQCAVTIVASPTGQLAMRMQSADGAVTRMMLRGDAEQGWSLPTSLPAGFPSMTIVQHLSRAVIDVTIEPVGEVRRDRQPVLFGKISMGQTSQPIMLVKNQPRTIETSRGPMEVMFGDDTLPLNFAMRMDEPRVEMYPGGEQPKSYSSRVSVLTNSGDVERTETIHMNHPLSHSGYRFYQAEYRDERGGPIGVLGVSRDPGQPIVFAGYGLLMIGILITMVTHLRRGGETTEDVR